MIDEVVFEVLSTAILLVDKSVLPDMKYDERKTLGSVVCFFFDL